MAMTTCRECTKPVSDQAQTCPSCGVQAPAMKQGDDLSGKASSGAAPALMVITILAMVSVVFLWVFLSRQESSGESTRVASSAAAPNDKRAFDQKADAEFDLSSPTDDSMKAIAYQVRTRGLWCPGAVGWKLLPQSKSNSRVYAKVLCRDGDRSQQHLVTMDYEYKILFVTELPNP